MDSRQFHNGRVRAYQRILDILAEDRGLFTDVAEKLGILTSPPSATSRLLLWAQGLSESAGSLDAAHGAHQEVERIVGFFRRKLDGTDVA